MAQYIVSITMGTPKYENRRDLVYMEHCTYNHLHQVFDDYASAKAAFRSAISAYAEAHVGNERKVGEIFERPGRLAYHGEVFGWRRKPFWEVLKLTERLLSDPDYECEPVEIGHFSKVEYLDPGYVIHCDEEAVVIALDSPTVAVQYNIHDMSDENKYYYLSIRVGDEDRGKAYDALNASLCPITLSGVKETRRPLLETLKREKEIIKRAALMGG